MAVYTTQIRHICESLAITKNLKREDMTDSEILSQPPQKIIEMSYYNIFDDFPIFNLEYKRTLCCKILTHYYFNEIGFETFGAFKFALNTKMREIMPYYNKLYESELLKLDFFNDTDYTDTADFNKTAETKMNTAENGKRKNSDLGGEKTREIEYQGNEKIKVDYNGGETAQLQIQGEEKEQTDYTGGSVRTPDTVNWSLRSDTPQGTLSGVSNENYLTEANKTTTTGSEREEFENRTDEKVKSFNGRKDVSTTQYDNRNDETLKSFENRKDKIVETSLAESEQVNENTVDSQGNATEKSGTVFTSKGKKNSNLTYSEMLEKYRETFLNIDLDIINELRPLFMTIY